MATNIEKKITKQMKLSAIIDYFKDMEADATVDLATIKVDGKEQEVPITVQHIIDFAQHEIELLGKKNSPSKETPQQVANRGLGEMVVDFLREHEGERFTVTELMKQVEGLPDEITNQRMTSLFRLDSVKPFVSRTMEKGRAYFQYAG